MMMFKDIAQLIRAIQIAQVKIRWKPKSAERHLQKRKQWGHLPPEVTLIDYEQHILMILHSPAAMVYLYWFNKMPYVTVVETIDQQRWLVMFALDGLLETAFVIETPDYLDNPNFERIGFLPEVLSHEKL